ncbi:hypothetical protein QP999_09500 [Corynebacterium sp. MSK004]|uniref:hypothetical protein n=1 Tax=Corynebacterium sp. MSK004 TaxID=3050186 RepID=UPI002549D253|nr:hypothetical protein [Corynebacterium sp. MSK004]MDK8898169.1 hypothetical protein [Corynebacterium sp. MSK004]
MHTHDNTTTPALETAERDPYEKVLLQAVVLRKLNGIHKEFKDSITRDMEPGDKRTVKNAQGLELGSVSKSAPGMKAVCTDSAVLLAMAEEQGREIVDGLPAPSDPRHEEIIRLLMELGRTDLLESAVVKEDADEIAAKVLEDWQISGQLPTGWEIKEASSPRVAINSKRSNAARAAIDHLVKEAGTVLALEAGEK